MNCPKCETEALAPARVRGVEVDRCHRCQGIWFDADELSRLLAEEASVLKPLASGSPDPAANARAGKCPRDHTRLLRVASARQRTVILETCPACRGLWLDGGELAQLLRAADS